MGRILIGEIQKQLGGYLLETISKHNFERFFEVYDSNQAYFLLTQGRMATRDNSMGDMDALPPGCDIGQKIYVGIWRKRKPVGVLDLIEGYPAPQCLWLGLLLVHGSLHGTGLGSAAIAAVLAAAAAAGYKTVQLGVAKNNTRALRFWQRHGFGTLRQSGDVVVLEKHLD